MKKYLFVLAGSLLFAATGAMAAPSQPVGQYSQDNHGQDNHGHDNRSPQRGHGNQNNGRGNYVMHDRGNHEGWYRRGGRVPTEYRGGRYVVTDWRVHHLRQPPRGYRWVRSDNGDFLMIAVTTGIIASILASH